MEWIASPEIWIALVTLTALEIVLGVDNVIFISILSGKLPADQQKRARNGGLSLAMLTRIFLLLSIAWIMSSPNSSGAIWGKKSRKVGTDGHLGVGARGPKCGCDSEPSPR
ncbi:MAG: hypothetical protein KJ048_00250 [Dehalococcoidia bacterium]|nr:hypothetical protein [Dehalococcoidia bacterium]